MTHDEIEQYLKDKDLNTFEYQLAMDAMLFAEQKTFERACKWLKAELYQHKDRDGYPNVESRSYTSVRDLIDDFKKAMEL